MPRLERWPRLLLVNALFVLLAILASACGGDEPTGPTATPSTDATTAPDPTVSEPSAGDADLIDLLTMSGSFTTLLNAIDQADLEEKLRSEGPFTLFAPIDDAFAELPSDALNDPDILFDLFALSCCIR